MNISRHDAIMVAALAIAILCILWSLERRNKDKKSRINLDDLLIGDDGKASKAAFVMHGSFVVTSWIVIYQTLNKTLSDLTFAAYVGAWVVPAVSRIIKGTPPGVTSEMTITSSKTKIDPP